MSNTWYPVIDYEACIECGSCVDMCKHGVYNKEKAPVPIVVYPVGCIQGCHGCSRKCPVSAIAYIGDKKAQNMGCSCECSDTLGDSREK